MHLRVYSGEDDVSLGSTFDAMALGNRKLWAPYDAGGISQAPGTRYLELTGSMTDLLPAFEATGRIIFEASDGETLEVIANADMTEPYQWVPTNSAEVIAFANHVRGLTDHNATLTLTDDPPGPPPAAFRAYLGSTLSH